MTFKVASIVFHFFNLILGRTLSLLLKLQKTSLDSSHAVSFFRGFALSLLIYHPTFIGIYLAGISNCYLQRRIQNPV